MAVGSGNSQMPHHLLRWAQMSFPAFVSPLVPLRAPAKAFRNLLCRTWTPCQVPPPPQELQKENPLWHIKGKDDHFPSNSQIISEMQREKSTAEFRKAQLLLLSRTDTAPSEASTNRQGSKGPVRTGTTKHWCLFLCAPSTRCWRKGFFSDGEEKEEKWWSSRSWRIRHQAHCTVKESQNSLGGKGPVTNADVQQCWSHDWALRNTGENWGKESHWAPQPSPYPG